jgi:hypothetical protein
MKRLIILGCALSLGGCVPLLSAMTGTPRLTGSARSDDH